MRKALTTATASTAGIGLLLASTSAKAFVPLVLGAIIGGSVLGGAVLGSAANNAAYAPAPAVGVARGPAVTVNGTTCYFTNAWNGYAWRRVQVCNY